MANPVPLLFFMALLITGTCIAGCTTAPMTNISTSAPSSAQPAFHSPTVTDLNQIITHFDTYADTARREWNVPGIAVAIVKDGRVVFAKGYGVKTAGGSDPVTTDTVFQVGSTSKAFTAALASMEVDSGRMNWSDPVVRYVPDFQMNDSWVTKEYTITDSLAQRSGLEGYWGTDLPMVGDSRSDMIHALRYAEPVSSFRSEFAYQNLPFLVTAAAIEKTSGKSWEDTMQTRIFTPLNMTSASTNYTAFLSAPDHASLHTVGVLPNNTTGPIPTDPDWPFNDFCTVMGPAGGVNADVKDMATWTIFQLGNGSFEGRQLISPENMVYLHTPRTPMGECMNDTKGYYCQGWVYGEKVGSPSYVWHNGETLGNQAMVLFVPSENLGIVVLSNEAGASLPDDLARSFYNQYFGTGNPDLCSVSLKTFQNTSAALLEPKPARPANATPPLALSRYTGSYVDEVYGTATVAEQDGNLTLVYGKRPVQCNLSPWDGNTFAVTCPQWDPLFEGRVAFIPGSDGTIRYLNMTKTFMPDDKPVTFERAGML